MSDLISAIKKGELGRVIEICYCIYFGLLYTLWLLSEGYNLLRDDVKDKDTELANRTLTNVLLGHVLCVVLYVLLYYVFCIFFSMEIKLIARIRLILEKIIHHLLYLAVQGNNEATVKFLLSKGRANVDAKRKDGTTALHIAVEKGNKNIVEHLLNHGANTNCAYTSTIRNGYTPLHLAVERHFEDIIKLLLSRGANVDAKTKYGKTALHLAVERGNKNIVKYLLNQGADIYCAGNYPWINGYTPLHIAVEKLFEDIMKLLLSRGANVDAKTEDGITALHIAINKRNLHIVEYLLNRGANINAPISTIREGYTPLHFAVEGNKRVIVKLLLSRGANVDAKGADGVTALHIAVERGYIQIVEHLLNHGANINCAYTSREAVEGHHKEIMNLLLSRGANIDTKGADGITALHIAVCKRNKKIIQLLLNHGANINSYTCEYKGGYTPLHLAVDENKRVIVELLLSRGANIDAIRKDGKTVLHTTVVWKRNKKIVELLFNHGANINSYTCECKRGYTPLHIAVNRCYTETVKLLLSRGASVDAKGQDGKTALDIALKQGNRTIIQHLLNHEADMNSAFTSYLRNGVVTAFQISSDCSYNTVVASFLKRHMIKMKTVNLYVSKENLVFITNDHELSYFQNKCEKEIENMKGEKVNNSNVSFYDILTKNLNHLAMYARNKSIVQVLRSDDYKIKFPIYRDMINNHFKKGEKRKQLLEQSNKIFHFFLINFGLPQNCTENIFSYLSNKDLRILIDTFICQQL